MEVRDGFIVGIFDYCDRWCETCAFTSRCRLFADVAELEASLDPNLKEVADAPPLPRDISPPPPPWLQETIDEMNEASRAVSVRDAARPPRPSLPPDHAAIDQR